MVIFIVYGVLLVMSLQASWLNLTDPSLSPEELRARQLEIAQQNKKALEYIRDNTNFESMGGMCERHRIGCASGLDFKQFFRVTKIEIINTVLTNTKIRQNEVDWDWFSHNI